MLRRHLPDVRKMRYGQPYSSQRRVIVAHRLPGVLIEVLGGSNGRVRAADNTLLHSASARIYGTDRRQATECGVATLGVVVGEPECDGGWSLGAGEEGLAMDLADLKGPVERLDLPHCEVQWVLMNWWVAKRGVRAAQIV